MATNDFNTFGRQSGKVGNVVGIVRKGRQFWRGYTKNTKVSKSRESLMVRARFRELFNVARAFSTNKFAARQVAQKFQAARVRVLGVLLNNVDAPSEGYYSYYSHYSYYKYYQYGETPKKKEWLFSKLLGGSSSKAKSKSKSKGKSKSAPKADA